MQLSCLGGNSFAPVFGGFLYTVSTNLVKQGFQFKIKNNGGRLSKLSWIIIVFFYLFIYLQYNFCAKVERQYSELIL